jgi:hypothetical protein
VAAVTPFDRLFARGVGNLFAAAAVRSLRVQSIREFRRTVVTRGALRSELVLVQEAAESVASANLSVAGWRSGRDRFEDRRSLLERT